MRDPEGCTGLGRAAVPVLAPARGRAAAVCWVWGAARQHGLLGTPKAQRPARPLGHSLGFGTRPFGKSLAAAQAAACQP